MIGCQVFKRKKMKKFKLFLLSAFIGLICVSAFTQEEEKHHVEKITLNHIDPAIFTLILGEIVNVIEPEITLQSVPPGAFSGALGGAFGGSSRAGQGGGSRGFGGSFGGYNNSGRYAGSRNAPGGGYYGPGLSAGNSRRGD
jgi:uncharacterized membrane protein